MMKHELQLGRAVGTEFLARKFRSLLTVFAMAAFIVIIAIIVLMNISAWWWLLGAPMILLICFGALLLLIVRVVIRILRPQVTKQQSTAVVEFVDKFERVTEHLQTPPFIIFFYILRDTVSRSDKTFIASTAEDTTTLKSNYQALQKLFRT